MHVRTHTGTHPLHLYQMRIEFDVWMDTYWAKNCAVDCQKSLFHNIPLIFSPDVENACKFVFRFSTEYIVRSLYASALFCNLAVIKTESAVGCRNVQEQSRHCTKSGTKLPA